MEDAEASGRAGIRPYVESLRVALEQAAAEVRGYPNEGDAFNAATELAGVLRELADSAADLRAEMAGRIYQAEELSLAGLAQRIGVSKSRADQLIRASKSIKGRAQQNEGEGQEDG